MGYSIKLETCVHSWYFGSIEGEPRAKDYLADEERFKVFQ